MIRIDKRYIKYTMGDSLSIESDGFIVSGLPDYNIFIFFNVHDKMCYLIKLRFAGLESVYTASCNAKYDFVLLKSILGALFMLLDGKTFLVNHDFGMIYSKINMFKSGDGYMWDLVDYYNERCKFYNIDAKSLM